MKQQARGSEIFSIIALREPRMALSLRRTRGKSRGCTVVAWSGRGSVIAMPSGGVKGAVTRKEIQNTSGGSPRLMGRPEPPRLPVLTNRGEG